MKAVSQCPVCDGQSRQDLVAFAKDPYLKKLPGRTDHTVHYVVCTGCGFVYQPQMMDAAEMQTLYSTTYRPPKPPPDYLRDVRIVALDVYSWITAHTRLRGNGRTVLDIGCAAGMSLRPFALQGWRAVGLDPGADWVEYGCREFGLDLRTDFYTDRSLPGEKFDLVLYSHVIEHVLDPAPVLAAIRDHLTDDGYLFVGTPNVLAPKRKLYPGLFGGDHVRLFSARTLKAYLQRQGFRVVAIETFRPRGLRALAMKADRSSASSSPTLPAARPGPIALAEQWVPLFPGERDRDDWTMIHALYSGLLKPVTATVLERNLAALKDQPVATLEEACRRRGAELYQVGRSEEAAENVSMVKEDGSRLWLYGSEGSSARAARAIAQLPSHSPDDLLLVGLGLGHLAEALDVRLDPSCRLHVWEPDPVLLATTLRTRDLSALFQSPRLFLHVGPELEFLRELLRLCNGRTLWKMNDPIVPEARHPLIGECEAWVKLNSKAGARTDQAPVGAAARD